MATATDLVQDAMFAAQVLGQDQTPASGDSQLVLRRLNRMLDSWSNEKQMIFANSTESFTMTDGTASYSTTVLTNGRPVSINGMYVKLSDINYPVDMIDQLRWNAISYRLTSSIPNQCFYDATYPNGTMNFYPVPYAAFTCYVDCQRVLASPLVMSTNLTLPPGYEAAIVAGLAVDIWPSFKGKQPIPNDLKEDKRQTRSVLKRNNYTPMEMGTPFDNDRAGQISNSFPYRNF